MTMEVRRLGPASRGDFGRVHCEANGLGWCRCVAWWVPTWDEFRDRTAEQNAAQRDALRGELEQIGLFGWLDG